MRLLSCLYLAATGAALAAAPAPRRLPPEEVSRARTMLEDIDRALLENYYPTSRLDKAHDARIAAARQALGEAKSNNDANAIIADALAALDPRIRLYPPLRSVRVDYGWDWKIIGQDAYVTHLDTDSDARAQGLQLGDKVLAIDGAPLDRASSQQIYYAMYELALRPGLRVQVQSPGGEPRTLALRATLRPARKVHNYIEAGLARLEWVFTPLEHQRQDEFLDLRNHVHRVGPVLVWRAEELRGKIDQVGDGLKAVREAQSLVLDLRGQYVLRHETALRLLSGLFNTAFDAGYIEETGNHRGLRVSGGAGAFAGTVLVLIDSETANYAEFIARVIQQKQRGVLIGDHTMGRVFEHGQVSYARGANFSFNIAAVTVPTGEIRLSDGYALDGKGVAPDLWLLPKPADLSAHRDVVMAKALAMLKQAVTPEEAYAFFRTEPDDDEGF